MSVRLQGEVAGFEEMHLRAWVVAFERFGSRRQEERVIVAPNCERRWPLAAKVFLESGIERDVAGIIQKQVQLDFVVPGPAQ